MPKDNLQKQKFSCVTQLRASLWEHLHLQKQKFSCVTQHTSDATASVSICKSRNFLVLLNRNVDNTADSASAKAEIFLCYSTESGKASINRICKSRNFLVLLNFCRIAFTDLSAKAEIFLCYSTKNPSECPF